MKKLLAVLLTLVFMSGTMAFASPFPDLPADHWATEAVNVLAEKGLVEGYPNGTFRGARPATRYEVAMVVARLLAYLEKRPQVSKEDLDAIRRLVDEFKDELDAMGVRLKNVEDLLASLEKRVTELERVKWSGGFETRFASNQTTTCAGCVMTPFQFDATLAGTRLPAAGDQNLVWDATNLHNQAREDKTAATIEGYPTDENYDIYPTRSGTALTEYGYLKVSAKLNDEYTAGGTVAMYNDVGSLANGYVYGVTPPTIANPYQAGTAVNGGAGAAFFGTSSTNLSTSLNQITITNEKQNIHLAIGDWRPALISDNVLQGLPNMGVYGPAYLPFYGGQLYGKLGGTVASGMLYEAAGGRLSVFDPSLPSSGSANYQDIILGGALGYEWKDVSSMVNTVRLVGSYVRVQNDAATVPGGANGGISNVGLWASPSTPNTIDTFNGGGINGGGATAATVNTLGPQSENLYGADVKLKFGENWKWLTVWGKYGNSQYQVSRGLTGTSSINNLTGSMGAAGLSVDTGGRITGSAAYIYVQPQYDPYIAQVPIPTGTAFTGTGPGFSDIWMGFPYPVSYGPPYSTFVGNRALSMYGTGSGTPNFTGLTGGAAGQVGGGDVYYNIHDSRQFPSNRQGGRVALNWNFGSGNLGGRYEYLQQATISSLNSEFTPGYYEPIFITVPSAFVGAGLASVNQPSSQILPNGPSKGTIQTFTLNGDYTFPSKELTINGLFTDNRIKRFASDFNNIDLHFQWMRAGLTYRPSDKWSLLGGYDVYQSIGNGRYLEPYTNVSGATVNIPTAGAAGSTLSVANGANLPANMLFSQKGPYLGLDYSFVKGADAWIMYQVYNLQDNSNNGYAGFNGTSFESGLRFIF